MCAHDAGATFKCETKYSDVQDWWACAYTAIPYIFCKGELHTLYSVDATHAISLHHSQSVEFVNEMKTSVCM